ncbi:hypothetical protein [Desulfitobacterium hafniense]|nr:hypothetical protein [Desulfitobacterium hafniense]
MPKWRSLTCPSCGKLIVKAGEKCNDCGFIFEPPEKVFCVYNKMMCEFPCRLVTRSNEGGSQFRCRAKWTQPK